MANMPKNVVTTVQGKPITKPRPTSPFVTLYHQQTGETKEVFTVDAREIVERGVWGYTPPSAPQSSIKTSEGSEKESDKEPAVDEMTKNQIMARMREEGMHVDARLSKDELLGKIKALLAKKESAQSIREQTDETPKESEDSGLAVESKQKVNEGGNK